MSHKPGDAIYQLPLEAFNVRNDECLVRVKTGVVDNTGAKHFRTVTVPVKLDAKVLDALKADVASKIAEHLVGVTLGDTVTEPEV